MNLCVLKKNKKIRNQTKQIRMLSNLTKFLNDNHIQTCDDTTIENAIIWIQNLKEKLHSKDIEFKLYVHNVNIKLMNHQNAVSSIGIDIKIIKEEGIVKACKMLKENKDFIKELYSKNVEACNELQSILGIYDLSCAMKRIKILQKYVKENGI